METTMSDHDELELEVAALTLFAEHAFVDDNTQAEVLQAIRSEEEIKEKIDASVYWDEAKADYEDARTKRKALLDPLDAAIKALRGKVMAALHEGREVSGAHLRELDPEVAIEDEAQLPEDLFMRVPDIEKVRRMVKAMGADFPIPGVAVKRRWTINVAKEKE
jgi:hypothetical protein